ncbi:MerR family transcriptional regulator [Bacteroides pyogenes]|uniref:MerR family transcriptional regulator n=1 Tax=Bacteroides pyogenes TaxID=310300 RepID=UPI002FDADB86
MDKTTRNALLGFIGSTIIAFVGAWVQLNSRISILEVQVNNDHQLFLDAQDDMKEIKDMLGEINVKVTHLNDIKEDRSFVKKQ